MYFSEFYSLSQKCLSSCIWKNTYKHPYAQEFIKVFSIGNVSVFLDKQKNPPFYIWKCIYLSIGFCKYDLIFLKARTLKCDAAWNNWLTFLCLRSFCSKLKSICLLHWPPFIQPVCVSTVHKITKMIYQRTSHQYKTLRLAFPFIPILFIEATQVQILKEFYIHLLVNPCQRTAPEFHFL